MSNRPAKNEDPLRIERAAQHEAAAKQAERGKRGARQRVLDLLNTNSVSRG